MSGTSPLKFSRDSLHPDILILYHTGAHTYVNHKNGDVCPRGTSPRRCTSTTRTQHVYLNKNPSEKFHLLLTLTHEIGHALGL
ncbi:hypothetical protein ACFW04_014047 [Cataglyphis niger]